MRLYTVFTYTDPGLIGLLANRRLCGGIFGYIRVYRGLWGLMGAYGGLLANQRLCGGIFGYIGAYGGLLANRRLCGGYAGVYRVYRGI